MLAVHSGALMPHLPPPPDPAVVLLIHPDAVEGIVDRSQYAHALTISAVTHDGTAPSPSQDESMLSASRDLASLMANDSIDFARTSGEPFTIEFSINVDPEMASLTTNYFLAWDDGRFHSVQALGSNQFRVTYTDGTGFSYGDLTGGQWYQLAVTYDGTRFRLFRDGVLVDGPTIIVTGALPGARKFGVIGVPERPDLKRFIGRLAEVRVTLGQARYTANYTPATTPFPNPSAP